MRDLCSKSKNRFLQKKIIMLVNLQVEVFLKSRCTCIKTRQNSGLIIDLYHQIGGGTNSHSPTSSNKYTYVEKISGPRSLVRKNGTYHTIMFTQANMS